MYHHAETFSVQLQGNLKNKKCFTPPSVGTLRKKNSLQNNPECIQEK